jgi:V/A-type H+-transporting ATPase subunit E
MTEDIKSLIEKINQEGIKQAEEKARKIEEEARRQADEICAKAKKEADKLILEANERIALMDEKERVLLAQAGRDLLLSLGKEIEAMLQRIIMAEIQDVLNPDSLGKIILEITKAQAHHKEDIVVTLKKEDLEMLEKEFLGRLKGEVKKGVVLRASQDIRTGFTISFDGGKSCFDFTDKALAEYIGQQLKPKLAKILESAVSE